MKDYKKDYPHRLWRNLFTVAIIVATVQWALFAIDPIFNALLFWMAIAWSICAFVCLVMYSIGKYMELLGIKITKRTETELNNNNHETA